MYVDLPETVKLIGLELNNPEADQKFRKKVLGPPDMLVYIARVKEPMSKRVAVRRQVPIKLALTSAVEWLSCRQISL